MADQTEETAGNSSNVSDKDEVVTLLDFLKEEEQLEEDAEAVLGASDYQNCTYSQGYMKRQALYACMTCTPLVKDDLTKAAGVCLACSYDCHEGHELIELYTKRNFRCDCGNTQFNGNPCKLDGKKADINELNEYNQNYKGLYCTCHRPYPDPEDTVQDEMIQCIVCEDWFHMRHLAAEKNPNMPSFSEMICKGCVELHAFLLHYSDLDVAEAAPKASEEAPVDVEQICKKPGKKSDAAKSLFLPDKWRLSLCACPDCAKLYAEQKVSFLLDQQDTVQDYEEKGKAKRLTREQSQHEREMQALSNLDRVSQIEVICEYNNLKENLKEYLQKFAESNKVVREEDIREFFTGMAAKKRQKTEVPFYCG